MTEERMLDEFSKINNELINARRELIRTNAALKEKERFLARILDLSPHIVYVFDLERGRTEFSSKEIAATLGFEPAEISKMGGGIVADLMHPEDAPRFSGHLSAIAGASDGQTLIFEYRMRARAGDWRWFRSSDTVFDRNTEGKPARIVGIAEDIGEEKLREERLTTVSFTDALTGLRNRRAFEELAEQYLSVASRRGGSFAVAYLDLDHFKSINDRFGHGEGDEALRIAAGILKENFRAEDILARYGGDEFLVLVADVDAHAVRTLLERLRHGAEVKNDCSGKKWRVEFSIGYAVFDPAAPIGIAELIAAADQAMYENKKLREGNLR